MTRGSALLLAVAVAACGRAQGVPDEELGTLVVAAKDTTGPVDLARAGKDPVELGRALARPYSFAVTALGPHTTTVKSSTTTVEPDGATSTLSDTSTLELGEGRSFHGLYENSADLGREVVYVDAKPEGTLFLRPRYQRWHGRAPETPDEPEQIRDGFVDAMAATWDLLAPATELTDRGVVTVAGRSGHRIEIAQAPKPAANPPEKLTQRKWRETRTVTDVKGEIVIDADSGVLLSGKLEGNVSFLREGKRYTLKLAIESTIAGVGTATPILAPDAGEVVATPERLREVDDRDLLLQGLAPPIHKTTPAPNDPPAPAPAAAGSATP